MLLDPALALAGDFASNAAADTIDFAGWATVEEATIARNAGLGDDTNWGVAEDIAEHLVQGDDGRFRFRLPQAGGRHRLGRGVLPAADIDHRGSRAARGRGQGGAGVRGDDRRAAGLFGDLLQVEHLDAGHMHYWERFDDTAELVTTFLQRPDPRDSRCRSFGGCVGAGVARPASVAHRVDAGAEVVRRSRRSGRRGSR